MKEQNVFRSTNPNAPGLVIATGGMPDLGGVQQQIDQLRNQVGAGADYTQPGNPLTTVYAEYETAAGQTIANATDVVVNFGTKVRDTHNAVTVGASWGFRAPLTGPYEIAVCTTLVNSTAWTTGEAAVQRLYIGGVYKRSLARFDTADVAGIDRYVSLIASLPVWLLAGQIADIRLRQASGGDLALLGVAVNNWIHITYLG